MIECQLHQILGDVQMLSGKQSIRRKPLNTHATIEPVIQREPQSQLRGLVQNIANSVIRTLKSGVCAPKAPNEYDNTIKPALLEAHRSSTLQNKIARAQTVATSIIRVRWIFIIEIQRKNPVRSATSRRGLRNESGRNSPSVIFCVPCVTESGITRRAWGD